MKKQATQESQVIEALRNRGGYATLRQLYQTLDFSSWKTKTPHSSVNRIVQNSNAIFKIQPGLWALEESREDVLRKFNLKLGNKKSEEQFNHGYYQGLLAEIGRYRHKITYIPAQDKNRLFLDRRLEEVADSIILPQFTHEAILRKAKTIDVIWFNERMMPSHFYEVEHTTDIKNSLSKFYELQDFFAGFFIVASSERETEYNDKINASIFNTIKDRVSFIDYEDVSRMYTGLRQIQYISW